MPDLKLIIPDQPQKVGSTIVTLADQLKRRRELQMGLEPSGLPLKKAKLVGGPENTRLKSGPLVVKRNSTK